MTIARYVRQDGGWHARRGRRKISKVICAKRGHILSNWELEKGICYKCKVADRNEMQEEKSKEKRRKEMEEKKEKAPRTIGRDSYICPNPECLEDSLFYQEELRLFECLKCGKKYGLKEVE